MKTEFRLVWGIAWKLANGVWQTHSPVTFQVAARMFSYLWEGGQRNIVLRRVGVNRGSVKLD